MADITAVSAVQDPAGQISVDVRGAASANDFDYAEVSIGIGEDPSEWKQVGERINAPVFGAGLVQIPADEFRSAPVWTVRIIVIHKNGQMREEWFILRLG